MEINEILARFKNVRQLKGSSYQARCPCHSDKKASLTITAEGSRILIHCHAGCDTRDIVAAVGLNMADLSAEKPKPAVKTWREKMNVEAVYDYGEYVKIRCKDKVIRYGRIVNGEFVAGMPAKTEKTLYRLKEMRAAVKEGCPIYYVEGEKDADNLRKIGLTAVTAGGCSDWKGELAIHFRGANVIILPDNDEPGQKLKDKLLKDIKSIAYSVKVLTISDKIGGDVSDFLEEGGDRERLLEKLSGVKPSYAPWVKTKDNVPKGVDSDRLAHVIEKSLDYIIVNKPGLDIAEFYIFKDGVYKKCSKNEAKGIIKEFLPLGTATDNTLNNVYNLLLCSNENTYGFEEINGDEGVINLKNGVVDLKTRQLREHSPQLLSTAQLNCRYEPQADCPRWREFIDTLCSDSNGEVDREKVGLLQEWTGLLISNVDISRVKKCLILTSPLGNTGKSVYLGMLSFLMGTENTANIPIQNMADRFALGDLCGKRLDLVGDQKTDDILDSSVFKQLTGGDSVRVEFKGKQSFNWKFKGGIVISCNSLPSFTDDKGGHIFERLNIIPCERVIPPEKRDSSLLTKLTREADGIFNWALEGLYRLKGNGFRFSRCEADQEKIEEYRGRLDTFYGFLSGGYVITLDNWDRVRKKTLEDDYEAWCANNKRQAINRRNIKDAAARNGIALIKSCGDYYYRGLKPIVFPEELREQNAPEPKAFRQEKLF